MDAVNQGESAPLKVSLIGLGGQQRSEHLPAVLAADGVVLDSVFDVNQSLVKQVSKEHRVPGYTSLAKLLGERQIDFAIVAVSHAEYYPLIEQLAARHVHILKEKPFAMSLDEAIKIHNLVTQHKIHLMVTLKRRFHPLYRTFLTLRRRIGRIYSIEGRFTLFVDRLDLGWRANKATAGGGALLDMGYHPIDLLVWYFGLPTSVTAKMGMGGRENQHYDVEDTVSVLLGYELEDGADFSGSLTISRAYPNKRESLLVVGTKGIINIEPGLIKRLDVKGNEIEALLRTGQQDTWWSAAIDQIEYFAKLIRKIPQDPQPSYLEHFKHMAMIEACYRSASENRSINPRELLSEIPLDKDHLANLEVIDD